MKHSSKSLTALLWGLYLFFPMVAFSAAIIAFGFFGPIILFQQMSIWQFVGAIFLWLTQTGAIFSTMYALWWLIRIVQGLRTEVSPSRNLFIAVKRFGWALLVSEVLGWISEAIQVVDQKIAFPDKPIFKILTFESIFEGLATHFVSLAIAIVAIAIAKTIQEGSRLAEESQLTI